MRLKAHANGRNKPQHKPQCWELLALICTCCVVHAHERNNCQHLWRSSKEAMHSGTIILAMHVHRHFHEANIVVVSLVAVFSARHQYEAARETNNAVVSCKIHANGATLLRYASPVTEPQKYWDLVRQKFDRFRLYATSANIVGVPCKRTQHLEPNGNVGYYW